jgi:hypothetical protein
MNKTTATMICAGIFAALLLGGCSKGNRHMDPEYRNPALKNAPKWVFVAQWEGAVAGVGAAPPSPGGFQLQRTEALGNARNDLARNLQLEIENALKLRAEQRGSGLRRSSQMAMADLADHTVRMNLRGSVQKDLWIDRDGTMHVLVAVDREQIAEALREAEIFDREEIETFWLNQDRAVEPRREGRAL